MSQNLISSLKNSPVKRKVFLKSFATRSPPRFGANMSQSHITSSPNTRNTAAKKTWDDYDSFFSTSSSPPRATEFVSIPHTDKINEPSHNYIQSTETNSASGPVRPIYKSNVSPPPFLNASFKSQGSSRSWGTFEDEDLLKSHDVFFQRESTPLPSSPIGSNKENPLVLHDEAFSDSDFNDSLEFLESRVLAPVIVQENNQQKPLSTDDDSRRRQLSPQKASIVAAKRIKPEESKEVLSSSHKSFVPPRTMDFQRNYSTCSKPTNHTIMLQTQNPDPSEEKARNPHLKPMKLVKPMVLSSEQEYILQLVKSGVSLFYTGSAGTGKSVLLKAIIKSLRDQHEKGAVAVTASTGLAACHIGGITLHSFAGVGLANGTPSSIIKKVRKNRKASKRWKEIKVLVMDEVSMIDGKFFNLLDEIAKKLRRSNKPFGGIQVVVCGDFYQLPPVTKNRNIDGTDVTEKEEAMFAFESEAWNDTIETTLVLKEVFRQKGDQKFIDMLNDMRSGYVSDENNHEFKKLVRPLPDIEGIRPTELFCTRHEVEHANNTRLNMLNGSALLYRAVDSGSLENPKAVLNNFLTPENLFLKKGAQVMCIKNFDDTLVNGSLGTVVDFIDRDTYMHLQTMDENPDISPEELKLKGEQASRGDSKKDHEELQVDTKPSILSDSVFDFLEDMASDEEDLSALGIAYKQNIARKKSLIRELHETSTKSKYPLVRFLVGGNHRTILVEPEVWTIEDEHMNALAKRVQIPLILAWSLSIHKSQGQTLQHVKVDLKKLFENGQAYVALSRAVSRDGLQVLNFDRARVRAHPKVMQFYASLSTAEEFRKKVGQQKLSFSGNKNRESKTTVLLN